MRIQISDELETLWEKEKLLIMSNFFFSPQCFQKLSVDDASVSMELRINSFVHIGDQNQTLEEMLIFMRPVCSFDYECTEQYSFQPTGNFSEQSLSKQLSAVREE